MRSNTAIIALGLVLMLSPAAWAGASNGDAEVTDPGGDAGPAAAELGPAAANFDILAVDFATDANTTTATMELAAFDVRPHETFYGIAYELDGESFVWFGYGKVLFPFPPFEVEGFYGCHITEDGENCHELTGHETSDAPGFAVEIPRSWAPANATLQDPMAAAFHDPFLPHPASAVWWEAAWPHNTEDMAGPGESYEVPGDDGPPETTEETIEDTAKETDVEPTVESSSDDGIRVAGLESGTVGAVAGGLGLIGLLGFAVRRIG